MIDWSNDVCCHPGNNWLGRGDISGLELNTKTLFEEFEKVPGSPKIAIMTGAPDHQDYYSNNWKAIQTKVDQVWDWFIKDPKHKKQYFYYKGKPLLIDYVGTPANRIGLPPWNDDKFTVRHLTGFISEQPTLRDGDFSKYGYWSWEDRNI